MSATETTGRCRPIPAPRIGERNDVLSHLLRSRKCIPILIFFILISPSQVHGEEISSADWSEMGNAQVGRGEYEEAVKSYQRAIDLDAYNPDLWYNKGLALSGLGRYEDALECYQRATKLDPFDAEIWLERGAALSGLGRYQEALASYDRGIEFDADDAGAWNNRGTVLAKLERFGEAVESYDRAILIDPLNPNAWNNKGSALHQLGRYLEAQDCYDRAINLDPLHPYAWHNKGLLVPTLDEETEDLFALSRKRIYVETEMKRSPFQFWDENGYQEKLKENENLPGWRVPLVVASILAVGLLLNLGGKGKQIYPDSIKSSLTRLVLVGDRSINKRR
ncbi:MAG: tetratricopeptide repeat protein [Methanothrix sp.]|nr:tetratricopeptide repeat protein [Methanothrix sp.]